jgi:DNA-binding MarR family transcriptional regulator
MPNANRGARVRRAAPESAPTDWSDYEQAVAAYTAAGGQATVQRVVTAISRISRRLDVDYRDQLAELGVSHGVWTVLSALALAGRGTALTPSRLADISGVSPSTIHRLDRMSDRGLLTRTADPDNRTRLRVELTADGWALFTRIVLEGDVVESKVLDPLSPVERRHLAELLERVLAGLDAGRRH